jgi:hypothetical protein
MLKDYGIIKRISKKISAAAEDASRAVLADYSNIKGREEEITSQLRGEINRHLLDSISKNLDGQVINGCNIKVATLKKTQEKYVGADLVGVIEITAGTATISKAFLAQAKVGKSYKDAKGHTFVKANNSDLLKQVEDMLKITSDSFVFLYSDVGILCISALQVQLANSNTVDTARQPFHKFGTFFEEFFKCFIGDHLISPIALKTTNLEDYAEKMKAHAIFKIEVKLKNN